MVRFPALKVHNAIATNDRFFLSALTTNNYQNKRQNVNKKQPGTTLLMPPKPLTCSGRKWEQKQVQIKTLEGEFSVTMWATGTDVGK